MVGWGSKLQEWCFSTPFECCVFQTRKLKHIWNKKTWEKGTAISDHTLYQHVSNTVLYFLLENTGSTFSLTKKSRQSNPHCANPRTIPELFVSNEMRHPTSQSSDPRLGYMERLHGQNSLNIKQMSQNYSWKKINQIRNADPFLQHLWGWDFQTWICRWCFMGVSKPKMQVLDPKKSSWMIAWSNEKPHQTKRVKNSTEHLAAKISKEWNCSTSWI